MEKIIKLLELGFKIEFTEDYETWLMKDGVIYRTHDDYTDTVVLNKRNIRLLSSKEYEIIPPDGNIICNEKDALEYLLRGFKIKCETWGNYWLEANNNGDILIGRTVSGKVRDVIECKNWCPDTNDIKNLINKKVGSAK